VITLDNFIGMHISSACRDAVERANSEKDSVRFEFNGIEVIAQPGDSPAALESKWSADMDASAKAYRESPEYVERERKAQEEDRRARSASLKETARTEAELREAKDPWPYTKEQLSEYIASLVDRSHDYGTCVYAMSLAAVAAFNYVARELGVSGFQSSCADLDFIRRTRNMDGPFILLKAEDALYPQDDLHGKLTEALVKWAPWLKEQAAKSLASAYHAHPSVIAHWKKLAK